MQFLLKISLVFGFTFFSCTSNGHEASNNKTSSPNKEDRTGQSRTVLQSRSSYSNTDTLTITLKSAVLFQPGSLHVQERMEKTSENELRQGQDDYLYYMHVSRDYLEKQKLPVIDARGKNT